VGLANENRINAPSLVGAVSIATHPPPQQQSMAPQFYRQLKCRGDKATRVAGPRLAASERIATTTADGAGVAASRKSPPRGNDVLKREPLVKANLQHAAVETVLQAEIISERHSSALRCLTLIDEGRVESLVANCTGIINKCSIRRRIRGRERVSRI
jgi:hypothetical protein